MQMLDRRTLGPSWLLKLLIHANGVQTDSLAAHIAARACSMRHEP
jgi:hypothetical protein